MGILGSIVLLIGAIFSQSSFADEPLLKCSTRIAALASNFEQAMDSMDLLSIDRELSRLRETKALDFDLNRFRILRDRLNEIFFWIEDADIMADAFSALQQQEIRLLFLIRSQVEAAADLDQARAELQSLNEEIYSVLSAEEAEAVLNALLEISSKEENAYVKQALEVQYQGFCKSFPLEDNLHQGGQNIIEDIHSLDLQTVYRARYFISRLERAMFRFEKNQLPFAESYTKQWVHFLNLLGKVSSRNKKPKIGQALADQKRNIALEAAKHIQTLLYVRGISGAPFRAQTPKIVEQIKTLDAIDFFVPLPKGSSFSGLNLFQTIVMSKEKKLFEAMIDIFQRHQGFIENRTNLAP